MKTSNVLVIGDVMLDIYYYGEVNRISPEAPVPVFRKKKERCVLGGAANVVANLVAAGQKASVMALIGADQYGEKIRELFSEIGVDCDLLTNWARPTITKTRFLAENNQQVLRLDVEDSSAIALPLVQELLDRVRACVEQFDLILLSDYMKGLLTYEFTQGIIQIALEHGKKVLVDVKDSNFQKYSGAWLLKPNTKELNALTKMPVSTEEERIAAARYLQAQVKCEYVLTTCGAKGMLLVGDGMTYHLDTVGREVYDVTGAGDTTIAYLAAALAGGTEIVQAMKISNYAAGLQVGKVGTSAVYLHEVEESMRQGEWREEKKLFRMNERGELLRRIAAWRAKGESVVTTNGCFDILHRGHVTLLNEAGKQGDHLVVLLNTDASVKRLKGPSRPVNSEEDRAAVISALACVDAAVLFDPLLDNALVPEADLANMSDDLKRIAKEAPMGILSLIRPEVHAKGGDYTVEAVPEAVYAEKFVSLPFVQGYSTTLTIEKSKGIE